jgi:cyclic pyranopterin phosphate synthase
VVVVRGTNDDEVEDFARLTLDHPWHVRFIELMPVGELAEREAAAGRDPLALVVASDALLARLRRLGASVGRPLAADAGPPRGNGPAAYHRLAGAPGTIGVITPMTHTYCGACNRVRLTAGRSAAHLPLRRHEVGLRDALRAGRPLLPLVTRRCARSPPRTPLLERRVGGLRALSQVGG